MWSIVLHTLLVPTHTRATVDVGLEELSNLCERPSFLEISFRQTRVALSFGHRPLARRRLALSRRAPLILVTAAAATDLATSTDLALRALLALLSNRKVLHRTPDMNQSHLLHRSPDMNHLQLN